MLKWITNRFAPAPAGPSLQRAQALREQGDFEAAEAAAEAVLAAGTDDVDALLLLAELATDQGLHAEARGRILRALEAQPGNASALLALARVHVSEQDWPGAEAAYREALAANGSDASAHESLGRLLHVQGRDREAAEAWRHSLEIDPAQPDLLRQVALLAQTSTELQEVMEIYERYLAVQPADATALAQFARVCTQLGRPQDALEAYGHAVRLRPEQADMRFARALLLLQLGQFGEGWHEYDWRWKVPGLDGPMTRFGVPRWDGRAFDGAVLLHGDPDAGEVLQFVRYAALVAPLCARLVVECPAPLVKLVERVEGVVDVVAAGKPLPPFDAHLPFVCAPELFGITRRTVPWEGPYVRAERGTAERWRTLVAESGPRAHRVGLAWRADGDLAAQRDRSLRLEELGALAAARDVTFYRLQGTGPEGPEAAPRGMHLVDFTDRTGDWAELAGLISQLELVIAVDCAVAHLAAAMGKPTWVLLASAPGGLWPLRRDVHPWYPTMRLLRQHAPGDWRGVVAGVAQALAPG